MRWELKVPWVHLWRSCDEATIGNQAKTGKPVTCAESWETQKQSVIMIAPILVGFTTCWTPVDRILWGGAGRALYSWWCFSTIGSKWFNCSFSVVMSPYPFSLSRGMSDDPRCPCSVRQHVIFFSLTFVFSMESFFCQWILMPAKLRPGTMTKRVVVASGYFNPLHYGHVSYLEKARDLGTSLIVIVNNDLQAASWTEMPNLDTW